MTWPQLDRPSRYWLTTGAVGNDSTVNTTQIAAEIASLSAAGGGALFFPPGTYLTGAFTLPSNIVLRGVPGASIIKAISGLGSSTALIRNATQGSYANSNITLRDLVIDGNGVGAGGSQTRLTELVSFVRVTKLELSNVIVRNVEYMGLALAGCRKVDIDKCEFTDCGYDGETENGGSAVWMAAVSSDQCLDVSIINSRFHDNRWHGLQCNAIKARIRGNTFEDNQEAHIFSSYASPNNTPHDYIIEGNIFDGLTKHDISGHAIEMGAWDLVIANNIIRNCDSGGIALTDVRDAVVTGNKILNYNALGVSGAAINIITTASAPGQPHDISITGNRFGDTQGSPTGDSGVRVSNVGDAVTGLHIAGNQMLAAWTGASGLAIQGGGKIGADSVFTDNLDAVEYP